MKFGYRDRIVLLIVVIVVIFALGIFVFIRPKIQQLNDNKIVRDNYAQDWQKKLNEFSLIPKKQGLIKERYQQGLDLSKEFTPEMSSIDLAKFFQQNFLNTEKFTADKVEVKDQVSLSNPGTATLGYYYYTPSIVTYPLYEYADLDGSLKEAVAEKMKEANLLSARAAQTVGSSSAQLSIFINREDTMALLDAISDYAASHKDAMMIESVSVKESDFNESYLKGDGEQPQPQPQAQEEPETDDEGNPVEPQPQVVNNNEDEDIPEDITPGYTIVTIAYRSYSVQEPTEPDVGAPYNPSIWDGVEWQNVTAPAAESAQ